MTTFYIGPDGNDANTGLSRVERIKTSARLDVLIDSHAPPHRVCFEGNFDRDWAPGPWDTTLFSFGRPNAQDIQLTATAVILNDSSIPLPLFCDYHRFVTPIQAVQVGSTPVWQISGILPAGNHARRIFACDYKSVSASSLPLFELWESGGALASQWYDKLGTRPDFNWTQYDQSGNLTTSLFIYCPVNPIELYGGITMVSDLSYSLLLMKQDGWIVDPDLTFQGGGYASVALQACQDAVFEGHIRGWHFYTNGLFITADGTGKSTKNLTLAPLIDTAVRALPFFSEDGNHQMGGHHGILIDYSVDLDGLTVSAQASNGRPTRISDCLHAGIGNYAPTAGKMHRNITVERNVAFDFRNVIYGRAYGLLGLDTQVENVMVGGVIANQPTRSQLGGKNIRCIGGMHTAGKRDGGVIEGRFGGSRDATGTASGFAFFTTDAVDVNNIAVVDWTFDGCVGGGIEFDQFGPAQTYRGNIEVSGCTFIASCDPDANRFPSNGFPPGSGDLYALSHNFANTQPEQVIRYFGNTAVGYTKGKRFVGGGVANGVFELDTPAFMPDAQNAGWKLFDQRS